MSDARGAAAADDCGDDDADCVGSSGDKDEDDADGDGLRRGLRR